MRLLFFFTAIVLDVILLVIFRLQNLNIKRLIFIPLNTLHCIIAYYTYITREKMTFNIVVKTFFRLFKFLLIFVFVYTLQHVVYIKYPDSLYTGVGILMLIDLIRAFFYEIVSHGFKNRLSNGIFNDILQIEPFFLKSNINYKPLTIEEFYEKGKPTSVDVDYLFDLWNDESIQTDRSLAVYTAEDINLRPEAEEISNEARLYNKRALVNKNVKSSYGSPFKKQIESSVSISDNVDTIVKPESYLFPSPDIENNPTFDSKVAKDTTIYHCDSNEIVSDNEQEDEESLNEFQKKDQEANLWISINEEVRKAQHTQPKTGRITKKSLKFHFQDKSEIAYRILSFNRTEELNYIVFRDNIRQINNERGNLYIAIECNNNLLSKIYYTLICIESLLMYWFVSSWLDIQPLLIKLCLPIFILPAFSSIKVIIESFLFIVYTHPYDPGDRIFLDGENYIVRDISLLKTTLIRWDGARCYIVNVLIKDKSITNVRRSSAQTWTLELLIDARTSNRKIEELQDVFNRLVEEDKSYKSVNMHILEIVDSAYVKLNLLVKHKYNFQNGFLMWNNHTKFLRILSSALAIIDIKYLPMSQNIDPIYK